MAARSLVRESVDGVGRQWELRGAVGAQWELRGAVARREHGWTARGSARRVRIDQAVVFPLSKKTRGHQTHTRPDV